LRDARFPSNFAAAGAEPPQTESPAYIR
jgi:hypothetical protein